MADFLSPSLYLDDLRHVFEDGAKQPDGIVVDAELCRGFVAGLGDIIDQVDTLVAYLDALGRVDRLAADRPLTPVERRQLARAALASAADRTVIDFPCRRVRALIHEDGGHAA